MSEDPMTWPSWATERVEIADYDPAWAVRGAQECDRLQVLLATWLTNDVEHIGSTAVPGLAAKPILDLQASVADLRVADAVAEVLSPYQWHYVPPYLDRRNYRRLFVKVAEGQRVVHLHLMRNNADRWHQQLAFRDALRADPDLVRAYAKVKTRLAERHPYDREAYTAGKREFIDSCARWDTP